VRGSRPGSVWSEPKSAGGTARRRSAAAGGALAAGSSGGGGDVPVEDRVGRFVLDHCPQIKHKRHQKQPALLPDEYYVR
jgi:hypothetical protein